MLFNQSVYKGNSKIKKKVFSIQRQCSFKEKIMNGPSIGDFIYNDHAKKSNSGVNPSKKQSVFIESYGCQMNFSDTEIVYSIMNTAGYPTSKTFEEADIIFLNTCAIRENAETKVWNRLDEIRSHRKKNKKLREIPLVVGVLGCMAERLKVKLLESDKLVDIVAGPDAYRDLPNLLQTADSGSQAINVLLSQDETYADISPVRTNSNGVSAYVSIMRGCNNMCTYCIVPFTRGKERSRPADSIEREVIELSKNGFKEITLLGQNVNSYNDITQEGAEFHDAVTVEGFSTVYKAPKVGTDFTALLDRISKVDPNMRIRFTSPHPKDFKDDLLHLIAERPNISNCIHVPAQSGSSSVLERMRRGYTRNAYLDLIKRAREIIPGIALSSDFIAGFCEETEEEHQETLTLMKEVEFDDAFMFAYSLREKTPAHRKFKDDVPEEVKQRRLREIVDLFYSTQNKKNQKELGSIQLVLVEGTSKRSDEELKGRTDSNKKVLIPREHDLPIYHEDGVPGGARKMAPGDYVIVELISCTGVTFKAKPLAITSLTAWTRHNLGSKIDFRIAIDTPKQKESLC
jgi:tRNA-N(6)-(isopentenyl)adenosine-37 thiotransferase enzyme MiaB